MLSHDAGSSRQIMRARLAPPRVSRRIMRRPALEAELRECADYRLTMIRAGTGFGKTTALASLAEQNMPLVWYTLDETDAAPARFVAYLAAAFRLHFPKLALPVLSVSGDENTAGDALDTLVNALHSHITQPTLLALDDFHTVGASPEVHSLAEQFIQHMPDDLRVVIATRQSLSWPAMVTWRAKGQMREISREALAFSPEETVTLFRETFGLQLPSAEIARLHDRTEGWPIALHLVWQSLRHKPAASAMDILRGTPSSLAALFDYLARDVMDRLPPEMTDFMRRTAVLRELSAPACDAVTGCADAAQMLHQLSQRDLFVVALHSEPGEPHTPTDEASPAYRYHHLFHDFLRAQLNENPAQASQSHIRAAEYFASVSAPGAVAEPHLQEIHHWLQAAPLAPAVWEQAARAIERTGETLVRGGQLDALVRMIDALPADILAAHPALRALMGDVYRLRSKFDDALRWYADAEQHWRREHNAKGISRALRGQASVYLDTVRPREAEGLLSEALRYAEGTADAQDTAEARARLLELLAENKLNMGKPDEAERLREEARKLRETGFGEDVLSVRVKLRTGRLAEARDILENWVAAEREQTEKGHLHPPRAHRESALLLSLVHSLLGNAARAAELAQDGIAIGEKSNSPFITAVGHIRLAHASQLRDGARPAQAIRAIQSAISLGDLLAVRRTRAEAMWSLTRAHGFARDGDLAAAEQAAQEGLDTARWAGDPWMAALIETALGGSYALHGHTDAAIETLSRGLVAFRECGDTFGRANARAWLCAAHLAQKQMEGFAAHAEDLLGLCEAHGYDFIFLRRALLGPPDPRRLAPVLLAARAMGIRAAYANRVLAELGLQNAQTHPGYQLRVQTLGGFRVWRGDAEVDVAEWRRDKARQLFQFLLMKRGKAVGREEITETLWPGLSAEAAARDFKVALNALNKALEPNREPDAPFAYVQRDGSAYFVSPGADMQVDAAQFEREAELGFRLASPSHSGGAGQADSQNENTSKAVQHLQNAVELYGGDYLPEAQYEDWSSEERERLQTIFLRAADRLAGLYLERGQFEAGIGLCERILACDPCWEHAYRMMMMGYARLNLVPQAMKVYQRCAEALRTELGIPPSAATQAVFEELGERR